MPCIKEFTRFDLSIKTTRGDVNIWYKLFIRVDEDGVPSFITNIEDIDIKMLPHVIQSSGSGFIFKKDSDQCRIDIINPQNNFTTRIKMGNVEDTARIHPIMMDHVEVLKEYFENIEISNDNELTIVPGKKLPAGYDATYCRRCERKDYRFEENVLRTSKEKVFFNSQYDNRMRRIEKDIADIFIENTALDELFHTDWNIKTALELLETEFKFQDKLMIVLK